MVALPDDRKTALVKEYKTLRSQDQDEHSILKALASKYGLQAHEVGGVLKEVEGDEASIKAEVAAERPAEPGQLGEAPPKGTVQSGKAPEGKK